MKNKKKPVAKAATLARPAAKKTALPTRQVAKQAGKPFTTLVILSTGDELRAAEAEMRLRTVARYLATPKQNLPRTFQPRPGTPLPAIIRVAEVAPQADATALALYRSFRALGRSAPNLFICAGTSTATPVILQTDWGNTVLTTQDGTLGLLTTLLTQRRIPHNVTPLNTELLLQLEQTRMDNPEYTASHDNALRDVLAPAAAALLAGVPAAALTTTANNNPRAGGRPDPTSFQAGLGTCGSSLKVAMPFTALKQADGTYLTNLTLDPLSFSQWQDDNARFTLAAEKTGWMGSKPTLTTHAGEASVQLSPHWAPAWDERFLSLHLEGENSPLLSGTLTRTR